MKHVIKKGFFEGDTCDVARGLLGKHLVRKYRGKLITGQIIEVEAYDGFNDKASHASGGVTPRCKVMFGPAGYWYVYFTYGMHWMLNVVTGDEGYPAAVLIRGVLVKKDRETEGVNGPGRVSKKYRVSKSIYGKPVEEKSALWLEDRGVVISKTRIHSTSRIGVDYAGPIWSKKKYRYFIKT